MEHIILFTMADFEKQNAWLIDYAGRQRMLSQKLTKDVLAFKYDSSFKTPERLQGFFKAEVEWESFHMSLPVHQHRVGLTLTQQKTNSADVANSPIHQIKIEVYVEKLQLAANLFPIVEALMQPPDKTEIDQGSLDWQAVVGIISQHQGTLQYQNLADRVGISIVFPTAEDGHLDNRAVVQAIQPEIVFSEAAFSSLIRQKNILVVDDESLIVTMLQDILEDWQARIFTASNGLEGFEHKLVGSRGACLL